MKNKNVFTKIILPILAIIMALSFVLVLTACDEGKTVTDKIAELTGVKYENGHITWSKLDGAKEYELIVNGDTENAVTTADNQYTFAENEVQVEEVVIKAKDDSGKVVGIGYYYVLPVLEVELKDGYFDWSDSATDLERYTSQGYEVEYQLVYDGQELATYYTDTKYPITQGAHNLRVRPIITNAPKGTSFYSNYSQLVESKKLATPTAVRVEDGVLLWSQVDFMGSNVLYRVTINGTTYDVTTNRYSLIGIDNINTLTCTIQAIAEDQDLCSDPTEEKTFKEVDQVAKPYMKDGILVWDAVPDVAGYIVEINGTILQEKVVDEKGREKFVDKVFTECKYDGDELVPGETKRVRVKAVAKDASITYGRWSPAIEVTMLTTPVISIKDTYVFFQSSSTSLIGSYTLKITRVEYGEEKDVYTEEIAGNFIDMNERCLEVGEYKLAVKANPIPDSSYTASRFSSEKDQKTIVRLGAPKKFEVSETNSGSPEGVIYVSFPDVSAGARYSLFLGETQYTSDAINVFKLPKQIFDAQGANKEIAVTIKSEPISLSENESKIYLPAREDLTFTFIQLAAPTGVVLRENKRLEWNKNELAERYGINFASMYIVEDTFFYLPTMTATSCQLKVFAQGDIFSEMYDKGQYIKLPGYEDKEDSNVLSEGSTVGTKVYEVKENKDEANKEKIVIRLSSPYSNALSVIQLQTPTNFKVNGSLFQWDLVQNARGYKCQYSTTDEGALPYKYLGVNENGDAINTDNFDGLYLNNFCYIDYNIITTQGIKFSIKAIGTALPETAEEQAQTDLILDSDWSGFSWNSIMVRLNAPIGLDFSNSTLKWNTDRRADYYRIFVEGTAELYTDTNGTLQLDKLSLGAGKHVYQVQAVGNGKDYFESELSEPITIIRLKQPTVKMEEGSYVWEYEEGAYSYTILIQGGASNREIVINFKDGGVSSSTTEDFVYIDNDTLGENGQLVTGTKLKFTPNFAGYENPKIEIRVNAKEDPDENGDRYMDAKPYSFIQKTTRMDAPVNPEIICELITSDEGQALKISTTTVNPRGLGFVFNVSGINHATDTNETVVPNLSGYVDIRVGYKANIFYKTGEGETPDDYVYLYNSEFSVESTKRIYICPVPVLSNMTTAPVNNAVRFSWIANDMAQYEVTYFVKDSSNNIVQEATTVNLKHVNEIVVTFPQDFFDGSHTVVLTVRAIGNDAEGGLSTIMSSIPATVEIPLMLVTGDQ